MQPSRGSIPWGVRQRSFTDASTQALHHRLDLTVVPEKALELRIVHPGHGARLSGGGPRIPESPA